MKKKITRKRTQKYPITTPVELPTQSQPLTLQDILVIRNQALQAAAQARVEPGLTIEAAKLYYNFLTAG